MLHQRTEHTDATFAHLKNNVRFENLVEYVAHFPYHKTNKKSLAVLCSVVKHVASGRALKKQVKALDCVLCSALPLPVCFTRTEHSQGYLIC